jgi:eukaryotic-like serine/threonine-protein kinase
LLRLRTLSGLSIERLDGPAPSQSVTSARRRLALLAVLAASGATGVPRDKLLALFWPDSDADRARHALDQALYALKKHLDADALVLGIRVVVGGAIDRVDSTYIVTAHLVDATSGVALGAERSIAKRRADVIDAVDDLVRRLRRRIGESSQALAKHDRPLPQATTRSLDALKRYADGVRASRVGQRIAARDLWEEAVAIDSDFALAHAELGAEYYFANERPRGDTHFGRALALMDRLTDRERLLVLASSESWRGNRERAIEIRKKFLAEFPDDDSQWALIGYDYLRLKRNAEAIDAFQRRLARDSADVGTVINLATVQKAIGSYDEAIRTYRRAFVLAPAFLTTPNLNHEYGGTFVFAGRFAEARAVFDTMAARSVPEQRMQGERSLGLLSIFQGQYLEGIAHLQRAVTIGESLRPGLSALRNHLFLGVAELEVGWTDSSRAQVRAAHAAFHRTYVEPGFLMLLGCALVRQNEIALASEVLDSLRRRVRPDNSSDEISLEVLAGEVALAAGHPDSAVRALRLALATDSTAIVNDAAARALVAAGDFAGAARLYEANTRILPRSFGAENELQAVSAWRDLGAVYERLGDLTRARAAYERMLSQWPRPDSLISSIRDARAGLVRVERASQTQKR